MAFDVLYTHQKTKKYKTWQDGRLVFDALGTMASLYDESRKKLERFPARFGQISCGSELETEKYLITVESVVRREEESTNSDLATTSPSLPRNQTREILESRRKRFRGFQCPRRSSPLVSNEINGEDRVPSFDTGASSSSSSLWDFYTPPPPDKELRESPKRDLEFNEGKRDSSSILSLLGFKSTGSTSKLDDVKKKAEKGNTYSNFLHRPAKATSSALSLFRTDDDGDDDNDDNDFQLERCSKGKTAALRKPFTEKATNEEERPNADSPSSSTSFSKSNVPPITQYTPLATKTTSDLYVLPPGAVVARALRCDSVAEGTRKRIFSSSTTNLLSRRSARSTISTGFSLDFPPSSKCLDVVIPNRSVSISTSFANVFEYKTTLVEALQEHLNIVLFGLAQSYHLAKQQTDLSSFSTDFGLIERSALGAVASKEAPSCRHGPAQLRSVKKDGPNKGRLFYSCSRSEKESCQFFAWADGPTSSKSAGSVLALRDQGSVENYFRSKGIVFYCGCDLWRKNSSGKKFKYSRPGQQFRSSGSETKALFLQLLRKDHSSSYSKDDLWIVSSSMDFEPNKTFVAKSSFYGPLSSGEVELTPISGYSTSNWSSGCQVNAVLVCNASSELTCIDNLLNGGLTERSVPLLPEMMRGSSSSSSSSSDRSALRSSLFTAPATRRHPCNLELRVSQEELDQLIQQTVDEFSLNEDQRVALTACATTVASDGKHGNIRLIHGVFGAGKSFLLAVTVLLLVELFSNFGSDSLKVLISSTTNVAVDRILQCLLDLGFEDFVRVGSVRKIAKSILPYTKGTESQELRDLQDMLKSELTPTERACVKRSIERLKQGDNLKRLSSVPVVGVTCAACSFDILSKREFSVLFLDECSQMTEPSSLIPLSRFGCKKLVLVGDPKQLSPTIQGSEAACGNGHGLEQTLFDRLVKQGIEPLMLRTQYRCHPAISAIANSLFYENRLLDGITAEDRAPLIDDIPPLCFFSVSRGKEKCNGVGSYSNEKEADFVVSLIRFLLKEHDSDPKNIGVITLYKSQLRQIQMKLETSGLFALSVLRAIQISTVDAFQGGEKEIIILSCVRTEHVGFIDSDRRMNVALTRAKRHLLIVGNQRVLCYNDTWSRVIQHCEAQKNGVQSSESLERKWNSAMHDDALQKETSSRS